VRFELIDQVIEATGDSLTAVKCLTAGEEYLQDHFPTFAVMPGVMMLESLVQAARELVARRGDGPTQPLVVAEVRNVRYGSMVRPGQTLRVKVELRKEPTDDGQWQFSGTGEVEEVTAVQGRFTLAPIASLEHE